MKSLASFWGEASCQVADKAAPKPPTKSAAKGGRKVPSPEAEDLYDDPSGDLDGAEMDDGSAVPVKKLVKAPAGQSKPKPKPKKKKVLNISPSLDSADILH